MQAAGRLRSHVTKEGVMNSASCKQNKKQCRRRDDWNLSRLESGGAAKMFRDDGDADDDDDEDDGLRERREKFELESLKQTMTSREQLADSSRACRSSGLGHGRGSRCKCIGIKVHKDRHPQVQQGPPSRKRR